MADIAGTSLAAAATAEQCIKLAKLLHRKYKDYVNAEQDLMELIVALEWHAAKIENQVAFLKLVWSSLEARLQVLQNTLLHMLNHKLQYAIELADAAIGSKQDASSLPKLLAKQGQVRKLYFAFSLKQSLQKTVEEIGKWHQMFDPTWFMISLVSDKAIDVTLESHGQINTPSVPVLKSIREATNRDQGRKVKSRKLTDETVLQTVARKAFSGIDITGARLRSGELVLVNHFTPDERASLVEVEGDIEKLTSTLAKIEPEIFGLLRCYGFIKHDATPQMPASFDLLFLIPSGLHSPTPLRTMLMKQSPMSLNNRLALAQSLSNAVVFVHASQFVHKNIRPETIMTFTSQTSPAPQPFLLGFEKVRTAAGTTFKIGDSQWERDLYRHPRRQGLWPEEEHNMLHDVYSLGVVLLEIGLWTNFVSYTGMTSSLGSSLSTLAQNLPADKRKQAAAIKDLFVGLAREKLPCTIGSKYMDIVISCLTCLDDIDPGLGNPNAFLDKDDVVVGVEFVEKIIMNLHEISF